MCFLDLATIRQSCRNFDPEKIVAKEDIQYALEVARLSPSACNSQPWNFTIVQKKEQNNDLFNQVLPHCGMEINKFVLNATGLIIISDACYNTTAAIGAVLKKQNFKSNDIGTASTYLTLALQEKGIDNCILGWFNANALKRKLNIKGKIHLLIAIGHANEGNTQREKKRKNIADIVNWR